MPSTGSIPPPCGSRSTRCTRTITRLRSGACARRWTASAGSLRTASAMIWRCRELAFDFGGRARVMGVLNLTPDSFSDGGRFMDPAAALAHARGMIREGAEMIDLGAESTRPGSAAVPADEQWRRLEPVLGPLAAELRGPLAG